MFNLYLQKKKMSQQGSQQGFSRKIDMMNMNGFIN